MCIPAVLEFSKLQDPTVLERTKVKFPSMLETSMQNKWWVDSVVETPANLIFTHFSPVLRFNNLFLVIC